MESYNSGYGGGGYSTEEIIVLYSDGSFAYRYSHVTSAYTSGGFSLGGGVKEQKGKGNWLLGNNDTALSLHFDTGETKEYALRLSSDLAWLNDRKFFISPLQ